MRLVITVVAAMLFCCTVSVGQTAESLAAFPGAEGSGADTPGGRGGEIMIVTSLEDDGPGSLREACVADEPRIVVFAVSGIVALESPLVIDDPFITLAGQTAPGDGVCL